MLRLKVREVAEGQGVRDPVDLASKTGVAYATAYRLWQGQIGSKDRGVGVLVLDKVARALGVHLWDLLEDASGNTKPAASMA